MTTTQSSQSPEQWNESIKAIITWIDPYIPKEDENDEPSSPSDPQSVRTIIEHMIKVGESGDEQYKNPIVHAHYLHKTNQFSRVKVSRFLAQEYEDPYMDGHPILAYYVALDSLKNKSIIESLRMYFKEYKLETPLNDNELYTLLLVFANQYCNDNNEVREKYSKKSKNTENSKIDKKTNVFLGEITELVKIYQQCLTSQNSLHNTTAVGRVRVTENKFLETLGSELGDDKILQFSETEMRQIFQGIKQKSLRDIKDNPNDKKGTEIIYDSNNKRDSDNDDDLPQASNDGGCCIVM